MPEPVEMPGVEEFEELRPLLFSIAYRMLGSVSDAEDAVQETWLRYRLATARPASLRAYLTAVVTRIAINELRSARVSRENYVGDWFPEPLLEDGYRDPERAAVLADSLSMATLILLERLSPLERAVFVLREVFRYEFSEIAPMLGRSEAACRQLAVRARRHMHDGRPRFDADRREQEQLASRFFAAVVQGDVEGLRQLLAPDAQLGSDSGGNAPSLPRNVSGADKVARLLVAVHPRLIHIGLSVEARDVNGQPGAIVRDASGSVVNVIVLEVLGGRVKWIRSLNNPEKLAHLGPLADPQSVRAAYLRSREAQSGRRAVDVTTRPPDVS